MFSDWLKLQVSRDDQVGDLAKKMVLDPSWPHGAQLFDDYDRHFLKAYYLEDYIDLKVAWREWELDEPLNAIKIAESSHAYLRCSVCCINKPIFSMVSAPHHGDSAVICADCEI